MNPVHVAILHPDPAARDGSLAQVVAAARANLAERHRSGFLRAGATAARIVSGPPDDVTFGARLGSIVTDAAHDGHAGRCGLIVLGSGAVPLLTMADRRRFLVTAAADTRVALANNRYSADIVAIADAGVALGRDAASVLTTDNVLPRWLAERAGYDVADLRRRWRLGVDIDGPLDLILLGPGWSRGLPASVRARVDARLAAVRTLVADPTAEIVVAGRTSPDALAWLTRAGAARTRAIVEERGLRTSVAGQRPPASVLGALLDRDGPASLGAHLGRLGEAAIVDSRVLLAHRLGADERGWPIPEDRFGSDLLLHEQITDPWLRDLTRSAATAPIPVVLGGHTLVGPGLRLAVRPR